MKPNKLIPLFGVVSILTGCTLVGETYEAGEFHTQDFSQNYYRNVPARFLNGDYVEVVYDLNGKVNTAQPFDNAYIDIMLGDIYNQDVTIDETIALYGNDTAKKINKNDYLLPSGELSVNYFNTVSEELNKSGSAYWYDYARHNNLSVSAGNDKIKDSFKKGYFSKLTDGLIRCDGTGPLVRMQLDENGVGQVFDHELISYRNFILSARGGTNIDYLPSKRITTAKVEFNISFYIEKSTTPNSKGKKITLNYIIDELQTDDSGTTTVMYFNLMEVLPAEILKRVSGMSIDYKLLSHAYLMPGGVKDESVDGEFALMLYEVMLPFSSWRQIYQATD